MTSVVSSATRASRDGALSRRRQYLLVVAAFVCPASGHAQTRQPRIRELATIPGVVVDEAVRMPNDRIILYTVRDSIFAYDVPAKVGTLVTTGFDGELSISRSGTRIAYAHLTEDGKRDIIWTTPIDPRTGTATGPSGRVSTSTGDAPSVSPDGRLIAFAADRGAARIVDLTVVPITGGAERILMRSTRPIWHLTWSADGRFVFFRVGGRSDTTRSIERVPVAGGPSESILSYTTMGPDEGINGEIAFYYRDQRAQSRMGYVTRSGTSGEFVIPPGSLLRSAEWSARTLLTRTTRPSTTHLLNLADGSVRDLLPENRQSRSPAWSQDGRQLALQTGTRQGVEMTVVNTDGSEPRRFPVALDLASAASMHWSPAGGLLAYWAGAGSTMLSLLDPVSGDSRVLYSEPDVTGIVFTWRPDGRSIVLVKYSVLAGAQRRETYEVTLDRASRKLRDLPSGFPFTTLLSDRLVQGSGGFTGGSRCDPPHERRAGAKPPGPVVGRRLQRRPAARQAQPAD